MRLHPWMAILAVWAGGGVAAAQQPIEVGFLWHMHQPIYIPGQTILQTQNSGTFSFSVVDVHNQRFGPYTSWPKDAIQSGLGLPNLGAQVSFSGSLIDNLNNLEAAGINGGMWNNWESSYRTAANYDTAEGNARLDLVGFGYHHPLMPLLPERDIRMQIKLHKLAHEQTWGPTVPYSQGIFPAETAFAERIIPALVAEGLEWAIVDNIHFDRATQNYPHTDSSNLYAPNRADQVNPDPAANGGAWVQLNNLWAPSRVSAPFSYRPHYVQHVDPSSGQVSQMVAVPAARYEGNEDGRGGFGALQYEAVMSQYLQYNTDPNHPMFVLLHHDGDNFGGGSEAYYHGNFQNMVNWAATQPNYNVSTVQDYLDRFPVAADDVIHVEAGSWAGADNGDPEFKKWLGDPNAQGWSPDRNSWAVLTAAQNRVHTADDLAPVATLNNVRTGTGSATERAWHYLLQAEASDHWYWDGTEVWDSNVTRGSNLAVAQIDALVNASVATENTSPTIFIPQRDIYNPGGLEYGQPQDSDFEVWTFAYDVSGLEHVTLKYRIDGDGTNPLASTQNETYAGGVEVGTWTSLVMSASDLAPPAGILPATYRAQRYGAMITGHTDVLIDYYVEALDNNGNLARSDIQHVWVGSASAEPGRGVSLTPDPASAGSAATLTYDPTGRGLANATQVYAHYGFNNWQTVLPDVAMTWDAQQELWTTSIAVPSTATQLDVVFNNGSGTWDNNAGQDWHFDVEGVVTEPSFSMDGQLDASAELIASNNGRNLYAKLQGSKLYVATDDAGEGSDVFIYLADELGTLRAANWAKSGQVMNWSAYLADENNNDFEQWFDTSDTTAQAATGANGGVLEGVIDLVDELGAVPLDVYLAVGAFATADGGALQPLLQVPAAISANGNLDPSEFVRLVLIDLPGDYNRDGSVDVADYQTWRSAFGQTGSNLGADGNNDGIVDAADYTIWRDNIGAGLKLPAAASGVPEPSTFWLALAVSIALRAATLPQCGG